MKRLLAIVLSLGMLGILAAPVAAQRPATNGLLSNIDVTGALEDGGTFDGVLSITEIALVDGVLEVTGTLSGTATDALGTVTTITDQIFTTTANLAGDGEGARCDILFLDLGPIHLDLLGLNVDLSQIILDVYAVPGAGNLLGNLLCAVAGLLDGGLLGGVTAAVENLINQINRLL
jgi:hypothetical protein